MERSDIEQPIRPRGHDPRTSTSILKGHPPYLRHFVYFVADKTLKPSALQPRANMVFHFASNFFFPLFFSSKASIHPQRIGGIRILLQGITS